MIVPCCCDVCRDLVSASEYENVTMVEGRVVDPPGPNPDIEVYARPINMIVGGTSCEASDSCGAKPDPACYYQGYDFATTVGRVVDRPTGIAPCGGIEIDNNCYEATGLTIEFLDPCGKKGWKGVQSKASWPGAFGFVNSGGACCPSPESEDYPPTTQGLEQSKYTTITAANHAIVEETGTVYTYDPGSDTSNTDTYVGNETHDWDQVAAVDVYGNVTRTGGRAAYKSFTLNGVETGVEFDEACAEDGHIISLPVLYTTSGLTPLTLPGGETTLSASCSLMNWTTYLGYTVTELNDETIYDAGESVTNSGDWGVDGSTFEEVITVTGNKGVFSISDSVLSLNASGSITYRIRIWDSESYLVYEANSTSTWSYIHSVTLSGSYTMAQCVAEATTLLAQWNLTDDRVYPFRTDNKTWLQPYVTRDAESTPPTIDWQVDEDCNFVSTDSYTGAIWGGPLPAGYGNNDTVAGRTRRHFDFRHYHWRKTNDGMGTCTECQIELGRTAESELPLATTQWTDNRLGASMYGPGGLVAQLLDYNYSSNSIGRTPIDGVFMQKWCETLEAWPSLNYARPCGADHFLRDEIDYCCVTDWTDPTLTLDAGPVTAWVVGDIIGIASGVYEIAVKYSATSYDLTLVASLPSGITYVDAAKLRFPAARGICGRASVVTATQAAPGDPVIVTVAAAHWLWTGDTVDFSGVTGLTTGHAITFISDTSFSVAFAGTFSAYTSGGYVFNAGVTSAIWNWDTTCSRHDYVVRTLAPTGRDTYAQTDTQANTTPHASRQTVLCVSPNGEVFPHGVTHGFGTITADWCYGNEWRKDFVQAIEDPFWQPDHAACGSGSWTQDDYPCAGDGDYPFPPLVEPRLVKPTGAPTLPVTIYPTLPMEDPVGSPCGADVPNNRYTKSTIYDLFVACSEWDRSPTENCP